MLREISRLFDAADDDSDRADYAAAIIDANCLSKPTVASRRLTNQRLGELYGLDAGIPLFRVFRRLWGLDDTGHPLLALLTALSRDPLLAATYPAIISLTIGEELQREALRGVLRALIGHRMNDDVLEKVCRNVASSWTQSGHLKGRTFKVRTGVRSSATSVAYAIYLAYAAGFRGVELFKSGWLNVLDCDPSSGQQLALEAKRMGLIDLRMSGDIIELDLTRLDPSGRQM